MDNNLLDLTSLLMDADEVTSSSRPSTPSLFLERTKASLAPVIGYVETEADFKNAQFSRRKKKFQKAERKEKKKIKRKRNKNSDNSVHDSNMQNDGVKSDIVTEAPKKPIFDLAGNIITTAPSVPSPDKGNNGDTSTESVTTKSPGSWLDKGPPLILLTTKSPKSSSSSTTTTPQEDVSTTKFPTTPSVSTTKNPSVTTNGFQDSSVSPSTPSRVDTGQEGMLKPSTPSPTQIDLTKDIQDKINLNLKNITNQNITDSTQINIVINVVDKAAERRRRKWLRRQARRLKCPIEDFRNSPGGYKCCLKSAKCFENLPEDIDEVTEAGTPNVGPAVGNVPEACGQIDQSLVCMARVLAKDQCKSAAEIVNKDLNEELLMVQKFYKQHCPGNSIGTTPSAPHVPGAGGQGQMASSGSETSLPTSAVIGAAIGGLFFIILIVAIACFVRRKRSRLPTQDKVAFQSSPTTSARYKDFMRTNSEVYAEIDEKHLQRSFRVSNDTTTFEREEGSGGSTGSRPLPTAPSDGVYEDRAGYVTPRASRENLNDRAGYDALSAVSIDDENSAEPYDKLARNPEKPETEVTDGDYITPESGKPTEKIPDNYHTYFVLEK
ncbi:uncharacterized protein LOC133187904 isoform X2 [Saccostrea echinata]|uniref:uncharacterized protein LOC133187904 isoform X2 n=1 Tax=Saccostrea echinata TaxID=191078 RepID=UPI002A7FCBA2|nr:uncharacterized protein LOC133187904 isoform X2 [Saccostrea echinata]